MWRSLPAVGEAVHSPGKVAVMLALNFTETIDPKREV